MLVFILSYFFFHTGLSSSFIYFDLESILPLTIYYSFLTMLSREQLSCLTYGADSIASRSNSNSSTRSKKSRPQMLANLTCKFYSTQKLGILSLSVLQNSYNFHRRKIHQSGIFIGLIVQCNHRR